MGRDSPRPLVFLDSNILIGAMVRPLTPAGVLVGWACIRSTPYRACLAEYVRMEVEVALARRALDLVSLLQKVLELLDPVPIRLPTQAEFQAVVGVIRHQHDVPVLASALVIKPAVIISDNTKDFNQSVARRVGIPMMTAAGFMASLSARLAPANPGPAEPDW